MGVAADCKDLCQGVVLVNSAGKIRETCLLSAVSVSCLVTFVTQTLDISFTQLLWVLYTA